MRRGTTCWQSLKPFDPGLGICVPAGIFLGLIAVTYLQYCLRSAAWPCHVNTDQRINRLQDSSQTHFHGVPSKKSKKKKQPYFFLWTTRFFFLSCTDTFLLFPPNTSQASKLFLGCAIWKIWCIWNQDRMIVTMIPLLSQKANLALPWIISTPPTTLDSPQNTEDRVVQCLKAFVSHLIQYLHLKWIENL